MLPVTVFWQVWQVKSFTRQCSLLGVWHFVELLQVDDFFIIFCTTLMALVARPIKDILSAIAVVALIFMANSFLIRSVSLRACTIQNCTSFPFSKSV